MSTISGSIALAVGLIILFTAIAISIRVQLKTYIKRRNAQTQAKHLAMQIHPDFRAKVEADGRFQLAQEKLNLERRQQNADFFLAQQKADREHELKLAELRLRQQKQAAELHLLHEKFQLESYLALHRVTPDTYLLNETTESITPLPSLKRATEPDKEKAPDFLTTPQYQQPSQEQLIAAIKPNSFTYSPGINAQTGEVIIVDLLKVPHLKIIGSTGFGKSCLCGSIIDQLMTTHDPRILQVALLDMEHKTSRLYEDRAHVASVKTGNNKIIQLVSTSPNEVAMHLKYLHQEMQRRDGLSGQELARQPIILIYIEELLALQYEVDPKLLQIIFQSLLLLAIRARKLGMFLLAAMQTDYSTEEMKINQKMFRFRGAAGVDTSAARAAGFQNTELIKLNFQYGKAGQFVVEYPGFSNLVLTAFYDVEKMLGEKFGFVPGFGQALYDEIAAQPPSLKSGRNGPETSQKPLEMPDETTRQAKGALVRDLLSKNWGKVKIIEKIWGAKAGASKAYKAAEAEYEQIVTEIEAEKVSA